MKGEGAWWDRVILGALQGFGTFPSCVLGLWVPQDRLEGVKLTQFIFSLFKTKAVYL